MSVLKRPILSEKSVGASEHKKHPAYSFEVDINAAKPEIVEAIEKFYEVKVADIRTLIARGKRSTRQTKKGISRGKAANYKKAVVTLKDGHTIDFYMNI